MYVHLPLPSSPFFLFSFGEMCWWDSQLALCVVLLSEVSWNVSGILPTVRLEFITAHFASSGKTSTVESATTMELSVNLTSAVPHNALCRTHNLGKLGAKALVSHTQSEKHQLTSKSLQQSHAITHFCTPLSSVPSPSSSSSAQPELCAASQSSDIQTNFGSHFSLLFRTSCGS